MSKAIINFIDSDSDSSDYESNTKIPDIHNNNTVSCIKPPVKFVINKPDEKKVYYKKKAPEDCKTRGRKIKYETDEERLKAKKEQDKLAYMRRKERERLYKEFYINQNKEVKI